MTPFFFTDIQGDKTSLYDEEAKHCVKVMRKREGEDLIGIDGKGNMYRARISHLGKRRVDLDILSKEENWGEKDQQITLLVSPLHKVDRFEWLIEKSVELGVNHIIPYLGMHTVKTTIRPERLERITIAALKQCLRSRLPLISPLLPFPEAMELVKAEVKLMGHGPSGAPLENHQTQLKSSQSVALLIGPEGDFADSELNLALSQEFQPVSLGSNRLRSETASIHLIGLVKNYMGY